MSRTLKVEELSMEAFRPFGTYARLIDPEGCKLGAPPIEFFRDAVCQDFSRGLTAFSTCRVEKRPLIVDVTEYHTETPEGTLPLDNDVFIHVGPATPNDGTVPLDEFRVFRVPHGTMVVLHPGVWHHAPFTVNDEPANVLIVLPERTYANDCVVHELSADQTLTVEP